MDEIRESLREEFHDPEARHDYAEEFLNSYLALQIKTLRQQRQWTQEELGNRAGEMKQSRISALERADYERWTLQTLKRLAKAFDLALVVRFESFGTFLEEMTSLSREALERPSFDNDPAFKATSCASSVGDSLAIATFRGKVVTPPTLMTWRRATNG
jgi:transcriptional regulator with XRE-family HTH domain